MATSKFSTANEATARGEEAVGEATLSRNPDCAVDMWVREPGINLLLKVDRACYRPLQVAIEGAIALVLEKGKPQPPPTRMMID